MVFIDLLHHEIKMSSKTLKKSPENKVPLVFMTIKEVVEYINNESECPYLVSFEHSMAGMGENVIKITSKNTYNVVCYINNENNKIFFPRPVSSAVINEILDLTNKKDKLFSNNSIS